MHFSVCNVKKKKKGEIQSVYFYYLHRPQGEFRAAFQRAGWFGTPSEGISARKKHISHQQYSHFLAEDPDTLVFWAAALLRQAELFLVFGVLLFQRLQLSGARQQEGRPLEMQRHHVRLQRQALKDFIFLISGEASLSKRLKHKHLTCCKSF